MTAHFRARSTLKGVVGMQDTATITSLTSNLGHGEHGSPNR